MDPRETSKVHTPCTIIGYKRSRVRQYPRFSLLKVDGVEELSDAKMMLGKKVLFCYNAKVKKHGSHIRKVFGKIVAPHGNSGVVRAKFTKVIAPQFFGNRAKVLMWPQKN
eukprot:GHVH01000783.1.p1 GENE.GHVH01000783.1~~GHVH01000783.1.p1  ORF type:complete len:110 (+),score=10.23 GHVH01000783.1:40-369(+)